MFHKVSKCDPGALRNVSRCVTNHHSTMMKFHDCVSYDVDRFLEPITERASVSDDKDRYYT